MLIVNVEGELGERSSEESIKAYLRLKMSHIDSDKLGGHDVGRERA